MRKVLIILSLALANCFSIHASSNSSDSLEGEKIYISSKNILIGENGIFVKLDNLIMQVDEISHDKNGIFIKEKIKIWKCPVCERDYPGYQDECPFDGTKKPNRWFNK